MASSSPKANRAFISRRGRSEFTFEGKKCALVTGEGEEFESDELVEVHIDVFTEEGGYVRVWAERELLRRRRRGKGKRGRKESQKRIWGGRES